MNKKEDMLPMELLISFEKLLQHYESLSEGEDERAKRATHILELAKQHPELREGFMDLKVLDEKSAVITELLSDLFPEALTENEIKMATLPYKEIIFQSSKRFDKILSNAGPDFELKLLSDEDAEGYIRACTVVLNFYYGFTLDFSRPLYYNIPDTNGVIHHYRVTYNADFMEILPAGEAPDITQADVDELLENPEDLALWKSKIPPGSFISKGFVLANLFDVTTEYSISRIKSELIASNKRGSETFMKDLQDTFRSFFRLNDLRVGFVTYDPKKERLQKVYGKGIQSFLLKEGENESCSEVLCGSSYDRIMNRSSFFAVTDVDKYHRETEGKPPFNTLKEQGIKSAIFAPIATENTLLGILEIVSGQKGALNGVNASKLSEVMPYIVSAVIRSKIEEDNLIDAVIQHECTTVHDSVIWKFQDEAKRFIREEMEGNQPVFREIVFKDVYPLFGQIDIRNSSKSRNQAIQRDLMIQLAEINKILTAAFERFKLPIYEELSFRVNTHLSDIKEVLHTNSEQSIFDFVKEEVNPVFRHLQEKNKEISAMIDTYEANIDMGTESYYDHRRNYDESVMMINKRLAALIDKRQDGAQQMFPHYFERYKTDGVEHNMYIGQSIAGDMKYDPLYLSNLRLWQLQVMCEMENAYYNLKSELPVKMDVASMILVYNSPLSIRFRMDEKRFDVDGTYNARYEVIKKRIDKSYIKGTKERITQKGKLCIVYSHKRDELEYLRYIKFLKTKGYFTDKVEIVDLEGLQGVTGLKAIRVEICYQEGEKEDQKTFTYDDLIEELRS